MRLLLDAHISAGAVGTVLREAGHDVRALSEERALDGLPDPLVLELAAAERRILVTFNVDDFALLLRHWAEQRRSHSGCILVQTLDHREFGALLRGLAVLFAARPHQEAWKDVAVFLTRATGSR